LLVPDVKVMSKALEAHINEHKKKDKVSNANAEAILDDLITQVLCKAANSTNG
jgi:hypothetical protein